jgi:hypothetical protein
LIFLNVILLAATLFVFIYFIALASSQHGSDAAGNAIGQAYTALAGILLWILLAILLIFAVTIGPMPAWTGAVAMLMVPAAGAASIAAVGVMGKNAKIKWPLIVPAGAAGLLIVYCIWSVLPAGVHTVLSPTLMGIICFGGILFLLPLPKIAKDQHQRSLPTPAEIAKFQADQQESYRKQIEDTFDAFTPDTPFSRWWEFTDEKNLYRDRALIGAKTASNRQQEIPRMLADFKSSVFFALPRLDLVPAPELEQGIRAFLQDQVIRLMPYDPARPMATTVVTEWYQRLFPTLRWLIDNHFCNMDAELTAMADAVRKYPDCPERQAFLESLQQFR